jgi:hypothetical protein
MKRRRRLSIEVERREWSVTVGHCPGGAAPEDAGRAPGDAPSSCRICGCPSLLRLGESIARYSGSRADLSLALTRGDLHLAAAGGELWLCERSFQIFQEARR